MPASATASGKIILLGEHAVVYGAPALAAGIDRGATATAELAPAGHDSCLTLGSTRHRPDFDPGSAGEGRAFAALLGDLRAGPALPPLAIGAELDLPPGTGLGSSAALGVAIARAALLAAGHPADDAAVIVRADAWERVFHGNPSGIDTAAAAVGGCFRFTRGEGPRPLVPARDLVLCVGLTGVSTSTREMVEGVARLRVRKPDLVDRAVNGITALVENAALAIEAGDLSAVGKLMDLNQMILAGLMLSTEDIENLCRAARQAGALGAKLTGKGGGGSVLALVADEAAAEPVLAAWRDAGYKGFVTNVTRTRAASASPLASPRTVQVPRTMPRSLAARAVAHPNIALSKYWGKREDGHNLPAVPSLSVTLGGMETTTTVTFDPALAADELKLNGKLAGPGPTGRVATLLDRVRAASGVRAHARVESSNSFPTAAGLASSASAFAALALAATAAAGLVWDVAQVSDLARRSSVSAARSLLGGFVALRAGEPGDEFLAATQVASGDHVAHRVLVAVTREGPKPTLSTEGMLHTQRTSPYYPAWVESAPALCERVRQAVLAGDLEALGVAAEESALRMHAAAIAACPGLVYWVGGTVSVMEEVRRLRAAGTLAYFTIDAGPHVKVLTTPEAEAAVAAALAQVPGVTTVIRTVPGPGAHLVPIPADDA